MIKIEKTEVFGWEAAIRGMRNPMNSWDKSDSFGYNPEYMCCTCNLEVEACRSRVASNYVCFGIGENDLKLMQNLCKAGNDHSKFMRMINVTCDITAPLYWWKEFDTYKVGTVANSCSTMHKIHAKEFTLDDFSHEHLYRIVDTSGIRWDCLDSLEHTIQHLNAARECYLNTKDKDVWWQMIQLLPSSYNQKRTVQLNYQVLKAFDSRKGHKLDEWAELLRWRDSLPYYLEITGAR